LRGKVIWEFSFGKGENSKEGEKRVVIRKKGGLPGTGFAEKD